MSNLISVVMPVLNTASFLGQAIQSVLTQTYQDFEFIIVDDGSDDDSPGIIEDFATRDSRIKPIFRKRNPALRTGAQARNNGIAIAQGDYIAAMDSDDIALPDRFALQIATLTNRRLDLCGGQAELFGAHKGPIWFPKSAEAINRELVFRVGVLHPTFMAKADFMRQLPYNEKIAHEDYEWLVRASKAGRLGNTSQVVLRYRGHPMQATRANRNDMVADLLHFRFAHFYRLFPNASATEYQIMSYVAGKRPLVSMDELAVATKFFCLLSDHPDVKLRERNVRRWQETCKLAECKVDVGYVKKIETQIRSGTHD